MSDVPQIFVSYSHEDAPLADVIVHALADAGLRPWIDRREIRLGDSIASKIQDGLAEASYLLLLWSVNARRSEWVEREWQAAFHSRGTLVIPVKLDDTELPPFLLDARAVDLGKDRKSGLLALTEFFASELRELPDEAHRAPDTSLLKGVTRRQLRLVAIRCMDEAALRRCSWDMGIDPDDLAGSSVNERIESMLRRLDQDGHLDEFAEWLELEREHCVRHQVLQLSGTRQWSWGSKRA